MIDEGRLFVCRNCGGTMVGDGYNTVMHCECMDCPADVEADSGPLYCGYTETCKRKEDNAGDEV